MLHSDCFRPYYSPAKRLADLNVFYEQRAPANIGKRFIGYSRAFIFEGCTGLVASPRKCAVAGRTGATSPLASMVRVSYFSVRKQVGPGAERFLCHEA